MALTGGDNYSVYLHREAGKWSMDVSVLDSGKDVKQKYSVQTNRGGPKTWRHLDQALSFAYEHCSNCQNMRVAVDGKILILRPEEG